MIGAGPVLAPLLDVGKRRAQRAKADIARRIAVRLGEGGIGAAAEYDEVRVTASREAAQRDGRLRWLAAWAKEALR
ncbi:hypothetical protein KCG44_00260 [Pacificimonas sp. WHA3]|uniref:Uncharacterized protein n=1 Tax=Pacificimonas pallii TaxID=2827236 RepID=A0ABS6SA21_9SPHN|nr:hypothetical protein [Pacificimonas pallii]MBV7255207.1 hypothetical protein [Pacificimonas pallii]